MRGEDIMGWVLVICVIIGVVSVFLPDTHYLCTDNEVYSKRNGETFWRKENVKCLTEDKT